MASEHGLTNRAKQIKNNDNPYYLKALTKSIVRSDKWNKKSEKVLTGIVKAKFQPNQDLRDMLVGMEADERWDV